MLSGQYAHNHRVLDNHAPNGGFYRFRSQNSLPVWLQDAGYFTAHVGKYLNGYGKRNRREVPPAGTSGTRRSTRRRTATGTTRSTRTASSSTTATQCATTAPTSTRAPPSGSSSATQRTTSSAASRCTCRSTISRRTAAARSRSTTRRAWQHRSRRRATATGSRSRRCRRTPNYNEADVNDKPIGIRRRATIGPTTRYAITEDYQQRLESLLAVDEGVAAIVKELRRTGELTTPTSSSARTTASSRASTASRAARCCPTRSRSTCRSSSAGRGSRRTPGSTSWSATSTSRRRSPPWRARSPG